MDNTTTMHPNEVLSSPCTGSASSVLPEANAPFSRECSHTGVSTRSVPAQNGSKPSQDKLPIYPSRHEISHWYALRTTYGREKVACDYMAKRGCTVFYPTLLVTKIVDGKRRHMEESRIPNIFFAYGTEKEMQTYVYDNVNLSFLRFYYKHTHSGTAIHREPLIVPDDQIQSLRIICEAEANHDIMLLQEEIQKFQTGEKVRIVEGDFKGVVGVVARFHGQQRVGIVLEGLLTAVTAYIPNAFLEKIESGESRYRV